MQIRVTKWFKSNQFGICEEGKVITCDPSIGKYIVSSKLGEEIEEVATTKDVPIPIRRVRKTKRVAGKKVETAAIENETT